MNENDRNLLRQMTEIELERSRLNDEFFTEKARLNTRMTGVWPEHKESKLYVTPEPDDEVVARREPVHRHGFVAGVGSARTDTVGTTVTRFVVRDRQVLGFTTGSRLADREI